MGLLLDGATSLYASFMQPFSTPSASNWARASTFLPMESNKWSSSAFAEVALPPLAKRRKTEAVTTRVDPGPAPTELKFIKFSSSYVVTMMFCHQI